MNRVMCVASLAVAFMLSSEAWAGGPPPVCMSVDRIIFEPNAKAPTRIQIWGTFALLKEQGTTYGPATRGYLYYTAPQGQEAECRNEWANLKKLVDQQKAVAFGACNHPKVDGHLRKPNAKVESPMPFPLRDEAHFTSVEEWGSFVLDCPSIQQLLTIPAPLTPVEGERLTPGRVTLTARNILDQRHAKAGYVFEIESSSGEKEESPIVPAGSKRTKWSPKMELQAGMQYTWRVRATDSNWKGPFGRSTFEVKAIR